VTDDWPEVSDAVQVTPTVLLQEGGQWWRFEGFVRAVVARRADEVIDAVRAVERAVAEEGLLAAGYLAYEAAAAYGLSTYPPAADGPPLLWFGLFRGRRAGILPASPSTGYRFGPWQPALDYPTYAAALARIKAAIARGDTYQANFTFALRADFSGDPLALFGALSAAQRADYGAYLDLGRFVICSASPELFFRRDGQRVESRPMKGTAPRGLTTADDRAQIDWLRHSEKNQAENVMIVDMIRNDLGRVAHVGSVTVPELFAVERYPTLLQMTSTVVAQTDASLSDLLAAVFPCASITGAPKRRTMQLLRELEGGPRGIYTGAIGMVLPDGRAQFNVAIRTAVIDRARGTAVYHVGSGVVWDSDAAAEYEECRLKARVLSAPPAVPFELLESLLWTPAAGYFLLDEHLRRLADSAEYFGYRLDLAAVARRLDEVAARLAGPSKVRLLVAANGTARLSAAPLAEGAPPEPLRVALAPEPVSSADVWLYHKTTRRAAYDAARAARPDYDDVILWNERGELTETTTSNLVLTFDGQHWTPPVSAGLLPGTLRARLLATGEITERPLTAADLAHAERVWLVNSVRGWRGGELGITN
jgi:para-aminobenzoate synthetase/4-amino-4-deoxychorismate lyase